MKSKVCGHETPLDFWPEDELCWNCRTAMANQSEQSSNTKPVLQEAAADLLFACEHIYGVIRYSQSVEESDKRVVRMAIAKARGDA